MTIKYANNNSLSAITSKPSGLSGSAMTLLATETASSSATISFTSEIDDTYDEYVFKYINCHPETDEVYFSFQGNAAGGSGYNETITSTFFTAYHGEGGAGEELEYGSSRDQGQGTAVQNLTDAIGNDNDQNASGYLHLFNPSSTTFVKHFIGAANISQHGDFTMNSYCAGYFNTTSAIDEIQFSMSSGDIDSGVIKLYGIS